MSKKFEMRGLADSAYFHDMEKVLRRLETKILKTRRSLEENKMITKILSHQHCLDGCLCHSCKRVHDVRERLQKNKADLECSKTILEGYKDFATSIIDIDGKNQLNTPFPDRFKAEPVPVEGRQLNEYEEFLREAKGFRYNMLTRQSTKQVDGVKYKERLHIAEVRLKGVRSENRTFAVAGRNPTCESRIFCSGTCNCSDCLLQALRAEKRKRLEYALVRQTVVLSQIVQSLCRSEQNTVSP